MERRHTAILKRILLIAVVLAAMLVLCACRTRITNNDTVTSVVYDEEGYMAEEYQARRDELGLSRAKKPLFPGIGGPDDEGYEVEYDDEDYDTLDDYDPDEEDDYVDDDDPDEDTTTTRTSSSTTTRRTTPSTRIVRRRTVTRRTHNTNNKKKQSSSSQNPGGNTKPGGKEPADDTKKTVKVTLDANGGSCSKSSIDVKTGGTYTGLPSTATPPDTDHTFAGWYTKKDGGSKVTSSTKVTNTSNHTLYAHWDEKTVEVKYTVIYTDGEGGEVFSDKPFKNLSADDFTPGYGKDPTRKGFTFLGWNPEVSEKIDIASADSNNVITYTADWEDNYDAWNDAFEAAAKDTESIDCYLNSGADEDLVGECNGNINEDNPKLAIMFTNDMDDTNDLKDKVTEKYPDRDDIKIIAVSKKFAGSSDPHEKLYSKLLLLSKMHDGIGIGNSKEELGIDVDNDSIVKVVK